MPKFATNNSIDVAVNNLKKGVQYEKAFTHLYYRAMYARNT